MYDQKELAQIDRDFAREDKRWTAPKFFGLGFVTLVIAVGLIFFWSAQHGCSLQIVP